MLQPWFFKYSTSTTHKRLSWETQFQDPHFVRLSGISPTLATLGTYLCIRVRPRFFDQVGHETMYASSRNKHFFTKSCHHQTYKNYEQSSQTSQNLYFQSHFSVLKICFIFQKKNFYEEYSTRRPNFIKKCFWKFWFLRNFVF